MKLKWTPAWICVAAATAILIISILAQLAVTNALAQGTGWSTPVSFSPAKASHPEVAADSEGTLHLFYVEGFYETQTGEMNPEQQSIMYFSGDGTKWTEPVDVLVSPDRTSLSVLGTVIDKQSYVHLIWSDMATLYHSRAHIGQANTARAWTTTVIAHGHGPIADVAIDDKDVLHVLLRPDEFTVSYTESHDGGEQWSDPIVVTAVLDREKYAVTQVGLALTDANTIHVTWSLGAAEINWLYWSVWYARSEDRGRTWTEGQEMASPRFGGSDIAVDGQGRVHLVWGRNVGNADGRWHAWSADGGQTWSQPEPLFRGIPHADGDTGGYGFALDSAGVLHLANSFGAGGGTPSAYYEYWQGDHWSDPQFIIGNESHFARLALAKGNELNFFGIGSPGASIWHSVRITDAPPVAAAPVPQVSADSNTTKPQAQAATQGLSEAPVVKGETNSTAPTALPTEPQFGEAPRDTSSPQQPLLVAVGISGLLVSLVIAAQLKARRN